MRAEMGICTVCIFFEAQALQGDAKLSILLLFY